MAIKKLNENTFDSIAKKAKDEEPSSLKEALEDFEEFEMTEKQFEDCLNYGLEELLVIGEAFIAFHNIIGDTAFGPVLTSTPEYKLFVGSLNEYCTNTIPLLLQGDIDSIIDEADSLTMSPEEFKEELEKLRALFFTELINKI